MMTAQSALEYLLPELQRKILLQLESFDSLHALIHASPRLYQVFRINRKVILSGLARQRFGPAAIRATQGIERLCQIEDPPFSRDTLLQFFEPSFDDLGNYHDSVLPLPVSTKLGKLDGTLRFFIDDYAKNTLPILTHLKNLDRPTVNADYNQVFCTSGLGILKSESCRLRRAFCRFEVYRQLFSRCSSNLDHELRQCSREPSLTPYEQAEKFFHEMPVYQVTEIACIRDYLHRRLRGVFDEVEDEIVQKLQEGCPNPRNQHQGLDWDWDNGARHQYLADDEHYFGYSGKYKQSYHIEYLLSLGLPYIRKILESSGDERQDLLLRDDYRCVAQFEENFITAALGLDSSSRLGEHYGDNRDLDSFLDEDSRMDVPPGWLWAHSEHFYNCLVDFYAKGLRDWGYVFWDLTRLQQTGVIDLLPHQVSRIRFDEYRANGRPCVKERWLGRRPPLPGYEDEEEEDDDDDEGDKEDEEGDDDDDDEGDREGEEEEERKESLQVEVGRPEQNETQDRRASHPLSKILSRIRQWVLGFWRVWWKPCEAARAANI